jgi:SAM-dependent methyltransferase
MPEPAVRYDAEYYAEIADTSRPSANVIAPILMERFSPSSVLDVGCGSGAFLDAFHKQGVRDTVGVDGPFAPAETVREHGHEFVAVDLEGSRLSLGRTFDLVLCLEVVEHLAPEYGPVVVEDLVRHGRAVAFSAAIPQQSGRGHANERPQSYWASEFARHGYHPHDIVRLKIWNDSRVDWWYAQNLLVYTPEPNPDPVALDWVHFKMNPHVMPTRAWEPTAREAAGALLRIAVRQLGADFDGLVLRVREFLGQPVHRRSQKH